MYLFLLLVIPCTLAGMALSAGKLASSLRGAGAGLVAGIAGVLILLLVERILPTSYRPFRHYFLLTAHHYLVPQLAVIGSWFLYRGYRTLEDEAGRREWMGFAAFSGGFYSELAVYSVLVSFGEPDLHAMLIIPLLWVTTILASSLLLVLYFEGYGIYRILYAAGVLGIPFAGGAVSYLQQTYHTTLAVVLAVAAAASSFAAWSARDRY